MKGQIWMVHRRGWTYLYLCWVIRWKNTAKLVHKLLYFCLWIDNYTERHRSSDKGWSPHSLQYCCCPQEASTGSPPFHRENTSSLWASAQIVETKKPAVTISTISMSTMTTSSVHWIVNPFLSMGIYTIVQSYTGKYEWLSSVLLQVHSTSNNANSNKWVIFFPV